MGVQKPGIPYIAKPIGFETGTRVPEVALNIRMVQPPEVDVDGSDVPRGYPDRETVPNWGNTNTTTLYRDLVRK